MQNQSLDVEIIAIAIRNIIRNYLRYMALKFSSIIPTIVYISSYFYSTEQCIDLHCNCFADPIFITRRKSNALQARFPVNYLRTFKPVEFKPVENIKRRLDSPRLHYTTSLHTHLYRMIPWLLASIGPVFYLWQSSTKWYICKKM